MEGLDCLFGWLVWFEGFFVSVIKVYFFLLPGAVVIQTLHLAFLSVRIELCLIKEEFDLVFQFNLFPRPHLNTVLPLADLTIKLFRLSIVRVLFLYSSFLDLSLCGLQGKNCVKNHNLFPYPKNR